MLVVSSSYPEGIDYTVRDVRTDRLATPIMRQSIAIIFLTFLALPVGGNVLAQDTRDSHPTAPTPRASGTPDWAEPFPPFRIAGNLYYVGTKGLASYLVTTPEGNIVINSDLEANVPLIRASVETLGFKFSDIKILLISHAHSDHNAASATIKKLTGAQYMVMDADVPNVESGVASKGR